MILFIAAVAIFVVAVGLYGVISPAGLVSFVRYWQSQGGFWFAAALRLVLGIALWIVAPASRAPLTLQILAVISLAAGISIPLMGYSRYESLLTWWQRQSAWFVRVWCVVALAFGLFLLWSVFA